jgi:DNA repair exonuclease SbcCD ATPase subunit
MNTALRSKNEAKLSLDTLASNLVSLFDVKASTLISAMNNRLSHDREQIERLEKKQAELSAMYNRYLDIQSQIKLHEQSIEKIQGLVSPWLFGPDSHIPPDSEADLESEQEATRLRRNLQLWEAIEQYLRFVPEKESRVKDIVEFLEMVEFECSRQSVEAAIKAHPKVFRTQKRKNEKFISLKGA